MRCIELVGSDDRMDCRDMFYDPINPLPPKCPKCGFPDLEHVPQPYFLVKSRTMSPNEMAPAENGNFFVRPRVRRVLELVAPGQCRYFSTSYKGTTAQTPWLLAVPAHQVVTATVKPSIPRCGACGEPRSAHPGTQFDQWLWDHQSEYDVLKSSTWGSSESGWDQWISRDLFMSARLFHLLGKVKAKGLDEARRGKPAQQPDKEDSAWIKEKLQILETDGIPFHADGTLSDSDATWLRNYIKSHPHPTASKLDIKAIERGLKLKLPKSYVEFITKVGPASFKDVDEQEGFTVQVLMPGKFDTKSFRAGALDADDEETNAVDGVMFAETEHGDCFCLDVQKGKKEPRVMLYKHEYHCFEPYAENFAACIKRFAGGGDG
jgi:hypothetical protein